MNFLPERDFNHTPGILSLDGQVNRGRRPFRYFNMWKLAPDFNDKVQASWLGPIQGVPMYRLVVKMKRLKVKEINRGNFDNIEKTESSCL